MAAAIVSEPGTTKLADVPIPEPGPGQVLIRLEGCGVCGSNIPIWQGREWFQYPLDPGSPGHEGWGVVEDVGSDVDTLRAGDRVAALGYHAFAEFDVADAEAVVTLPDWLEDRAFPGEPLGCAVNVFRRSDIQAGQTVAIVGVGFLGALLTQLAKAAGARVIAVSKRAYSLSVASNAGADELIPMNDHWEIIARVKELTGGRLCERVIEAAGVQWPLDLAGELTGERGRLIIAGYHQDGLRSVNMQLWNWRGLDVICAHERETAVYTRGMRDAVEAIRDGRMDPFPFFTHTFSLREVGEALDLLEDRPEGFVKALVRCDA